jgi:hypothetical protein
MGCPEEAREQNGHLAKFALVLAYADVFEISSQPDARTIDVILHA